MIDIHIHPSFGGASKGEIVRFLDRYQIDQAWLLSLEATPDAALDEAENPAPCILNAEVWDLFRDRPQRFIPGFTLPQRSPHLQERVDRYSRLGFRLFGEWKVPGLRFDAPECECLYEVLEEKRVPLLFHVGRSGFSERQLAAFSHMIGKYRNLVFIAHSMGWWKYVSARWKAEVDDDYPAGPIAPGGPAERLLESHENLYADFDMVEGVSAMVRDLSFAERFLHKYSARLLYGSDYPCELAWPPFFSRFLLWRDCVLLNNPTPKELEGRYPGYGELATFFGTGTSLRRDVLDENARRLIPLGPDQRGADAAHGNAQGQRC